MAISVTRDGRTGTTMVNDLDDDVLKDSVKRAEGLASIAPPNPEHSTPLGRQDYPETNDYDEKTALARAPEMIPQIKAVIDTARKQKLVAAGLFERITTNSAIANKAGLFGFHRSADSKLTTTVRMADGSSSGWAGLPSTRIAEISGAELAATACQKCARWKNPEGSSPASTRWCLSQRLRAISFICLAGGFFGQGFSARAAEEGRTFLSKKGGGTLLGEKMFPDFITLRHRSIRSAAALDALDQ